MDPEKTHHRQLRKLLRMASTMAGDGKSTPRIKSGNCSVTFNSNNASSKSASTAGATASSSTSDIYDKQMVWKLHGQRKIQSKTHELTSLEAQECTFAPKTNRSKRRSLPDSPLSPAKDDHVAAVEVASPLSSQLRLRSSESVFSFVDDSSYGSPSSSIVRPSGSITATDGTTGTSTTPMHRTESQESSIQLHLVRQERAREHAQDAQQKLFASSNAQHKAKDFTKVTAFVPFKLSVGNQKPRASSASPTKTRQRTSSIPPSTSTSNNSGGDQASSPTGEQQQQRRATIKDNVERSKSFKKSSRAQSTTAAAAASNYHHHQHFASGNGSLSQPQQQQESKEESWDKERSNLLSLLETQRRELELREKAQQDALHIAADFATAIQSFEARLLLVERSTAQELASVRELLQRQATATELILQSLGIAQLPPVASSAPAPPPDSPPLRSPTSSNSSTVRRETK